MKKNNKLKDLIINKNKYLKIVYMDNDDIIDYETIEIKIIKIRKYNKLINDIAYKMYKLNANGFYFIFNKNISLNKIIFSIKLKKDLLGFLGYILIKHNNYSYILNNNGKIKININKKIDNFSGINPKKIIMENPFLKIKINSIIDIVKIIKIMTDNKISSLLVGFNKNEKIELIKEFPNELIKLSYRKIGEYIREIRLISNITKIVLITNNRFVFERALDLKEENYIDNCISYMMIKNKVKILENGSNHKGENIYG